MRLTLLLVLGIVILVLSGTSVYFVLSQMNRSGMLGPRDGSASSGKVHKATAGTTIRAGDLKVTVMRLSSETRQTRFDLFVFTENPGKTFQFKAWTGGDSWSDVRNNLSPMKDDLGNSYEPRLIRDDYLNDQAGVTPSMRAIAWFDKRGLPRPKTIQYGSGQITTDLGCVDVLCFEKAVPGAKKLTITLPGENIGQREPIVLVFDCNDFEEGEWKLP